MKRAGPMVLAALAACAIQPEDPGAPGVAGCPKYAAEPVQTGANGASLSELSGLAASATNPGVYWAHNDSGNAFELYAMHEDGTVLATYALTGARSVDTEDVAVAPCAAGDGGTPQSCIWLGDIGDNDLSRTSARLYRVPEPAVLASGTLGVEVLNFTYPSGPRDCEGLFVDRSAVPYVVTKTAGSLGEVYRLENLSGVGRAVLVTTLLSGGADHTSGAALHPGGERLALRTASHVFEYRSAGARSVEELLAQSPVDLPQGSQPQAEAIAYTPDGLGYLMGSEGAGAPLYREDCAPP